MVHDIKQFYDSLNFDDIDMEYKWKELEIKRKGLSYYVVQSLLKNVQKGPSILDVGGVSGINLDIYGKAFETEYLYNMDVRVPDKKIDGVKYIEGSAEEIDKTSLPMVNCIVMTEVIEHFFDTDKVLDDLLGILKHEGTIIITTPNLSGFLNVVLLSAGYQPPDTEVPAMYTYGKLFTRTGNCVGYIHIFTFKALNEMLKRHGLKIISLNSIGRTLSSKKDPLKLKAISYIDVLFSHISKRGGTGIIAVCQKYEVKL